MKLLTNTATVSGITAATLLALNIDMFLIAYLLFLLSSILWCIYALNIKNNQLFLMNITFTLINAIGVYNFL